MIPPRTVHQSKEKPHFNPPNTTDLNQHSHYLDNLCFYSQLCTSSNMQQYIHFIESHLTKKPN